MLRRRAQLREQLVVSLQGRERESAKLGARRLRAPDKRQPHTFACMHLLEGKAIRDERKMQPVVQKTAGSIAAVATTRTLRQYTTAGVAAAAAREHTRRHYDDDDDDGDGDYGVLQLCIVKRDAQALLVIHSRARVQFTNNCNSNNNSDSRIRVIGELAV